MDDFFNSLLDLFAYICSSIDNLVIYIPFVVACICVTFAFISRLMRLSKR